MAGRLRAAPDQKHASPLSLLLTFAAWSSNRAHRAKKCRPRVDNAGRSPQSNRGLRQIQSCASRKTRGLTRGNYLNEKRPNEQLLEVRSAARWIRSGEQS